MLLNSWRPPAQLRVGVCRWPSLASPAASAQAFLLWGLVVDARAPEAGLANDGGNMEGMAGNEARSHFEAGRSAAAPDDCQEQARRSPHAAVLASA